MFLASLHPCILASLHPCILAGLTTCVRHIYPLSSSRPCVLLPPNSFLLHITPSETNIFLSCVSKLSLARSLTGSFLVSCRLLKSTEVVFNFASLDLDRHSAISATFTYLTSCSLIGLQDLESKPTNPRSVLQNVLQKGFIPCVPNKGRMMELLCVLPKVWGRDPYPSGAFRLPLAEFLRKPGW